MQNTTKKKCSCWGWVGLCLKGSYRLSAWNSPESSEVMLILTHHIFYRRWREWQQTGDSPNQQVSGRVSGAASQREPAAAKRLRIIGIDFGPSSGSSCRGRWTEDRVPRTRYRNGRVRQSGASGVRVFPKMRCRQRRLRVRFRHRERSLPPVGRY